MSDFRNVGAIGTVNHILEFIAMDTQLILWKTFDPVCENMTVGKGSVHEEYIFYQDVIDIRAHAPKELLEEDVWWVEATAKGIMTLLIG